MRCDEIQERFVELLYGEHRADQGELQEHMRSCPACRRELEELKQTQSALRLWKDESPLRSVVIPPGTRLGRSRRHSISLRFFRYAAVAAMVAIAFLALANAQISWNREGFSFSTHLFYWRNNDRGEYYTKAEVRNLLKQVLDDSEARTTETNYLMMQRMLDTIEQDRWMDLRLINDTRARTGNKN